MKRIASISVLSVLATAAVAQDIWEVAPIAISPAGEDYAPVFLDSGFVISSVRETGGTITFTDAETNKPLSDLYWVPFKNGVAGLPVIFSANLATPVNEGPAAFTDGGRTICFTRNQVLPKKLANMRSANGEIGLFFATLKNGAWGTPEAFPHNNTKYSILHPTFSPDGRTLYFASDMPGGTGGMDLYRSQRTSAGWSAPVSLGTTVNSMSNEVYPRMHADGSLSFASDRSGGLGKLDIFTTTMDGSAWLPPTAMPAPVNGPGDDHGFTLLPGGRTALFCSNRGGSDAIHFAKFTVPKFRECAQQQLNNYCYSFKRRQHAATTSIPVDHVWDMGDGTRIPGYQAQHCYAKPGNYTVRSLLLDRKSREIFHILSSNDLVVEDIQQAWIASQDTVRTGRALELDGSMSFLPGMKAVEHHWDMGDGSILAGLRQEHVFRAPGTYQVRLDVLSEPDANGVISNRCNTKTIVVIDRFRDHEDMTVVAAYQDAFGKTHTFEYQELPFDAASIEGDALTEVTFSVQLFASKDRMDLDDPRFAQIRKLYRVVERFDPESKLYTYSVGETSSVEELYQVFRKVKELQFMDAEVFALRVEKLMDMSQLDLASLEDLNYKKLRTNAINFAYKSAALEPGSELVLEQMIDLLRQHPELQLVIEAHTDDIGGRQYNLGLSQERALAVATYLIEHEVDPSRLIPIGHGKNQPIASNKTEEGRSQNRRVEFRMTVKGAADVPTSNLTIAMPARTAAPPSR
ncbi:MAG: OmpA family protein [Flavobacteriales bacterium]|nr:OmpA family protein [Flavobacteriales bacterium]